VTLVILAYDGSGPARAAVREAGRVLAPREALVVTMWEQALATMAIMPTIAPVTEMMPPDIDTADELNRAASKHASAVAAEGAELARSVGFDAEPLAIGEEVNVPEAIARLAQDRGAEVVVVGSRGLSGLKASLLGSTSQGVLHRCRMPVLVVRESADDASA
jgi:nucleotide-binding universal stress UspA family protein